VQVPPRPPSLAEDLALELDARTSRPDTVLTGDVCVIGAGPVGLAVADTLRSRGVGVVVLESGTTAPDPRTRDLDEGERVDGTYTDLRDVRARGVGGTATIWNTVLHGEPMAKYVPLDEVDFERRPWIPHSGWPFGRETMDPWYQRAHAICGLAPYRPGEPPDALGYPVLSFPADGLHTGVYHYGPASRFTDALPADLRAATGVTLVQGATATGIVRDRTGRCVREVRWRTFGEGSGSVRASTFVLAAGGMENARLLLLAREHEEPGQDDGWLGAGFMEHPIDATLELVTHAPALVPPEGFYSPAGIGTVTNVVGRIALAPELLRAEQLPNASIRLVHHRNPPVVRSPSLSRAARRLVPTSALRRWVGGTLRRIWRSSAPVVGTTYQVLIDLEQLPSRENRVTLADRCDAFGRPRLRLHWRWTAADEACRQRILTVVERELVRAGVGRMRRVRVGPPDPAAHHPMGTTRMHADAAEGVVDADLRVHGTANLYVAGSSVFPTSGYANPTLTAIALAVRLADHLACA
jgi:choline dehydrogenase-like flavoprotein